MAVVSGYEYEPLFLTGLYSAVNTFAVWYYK